MRSFDYTIKAFIGIHARPAALLTSFVNKYQSQIIIRHKNKEANVKNIMDLMLLCVMYGDTVTFILNGSDEEKASIALKSFCEKNL